MNQEILKQKIKEKGLSLYRLSLSSGIGYATLHDLTTGKTENPKINTVAKLASALDEKIENLI